jgi:asparagine synthase (glutamine-hydrolysing)
MCGIGGVIRWDGEPIPDEWLDAIDAGIAHRGPDGAGRFRDAADIITPHGPRRVEVALVHRRLSIIDHDGGGQPMVSPRGRHDGEDLVAVVFNGCIYNHRELRRELEAAGHRFTSDHSDTEVLIHGHRAWGSRLRDHLEGMYAYAIWDRGAATLTLGRDRFGEKPLYWRGDDASPVLRFSSSRAALGDAAASDAARRLWTANYLRRGYAWGASPIPGSEQTHRVYPAHALAIGPTDHALHAPPPPPEGVEPLDPDRTETLLEQAVARRLEADVALGCFLSGGVDSSLVALYARRHRADLRTFSVRMPDARYDESGHARRVAEHLGTDHTTLDVAMNPAADLAHLVRLLGQPFADSSILPTYWVSRAGREHVKVALSGDGGDELFLGYERYLAADALGRHAGLLRMIPRVLHRGAHPKSRRSKLARLGDMARDYRTLGIAAMGSIFTQPEIARLQGRPAPSDPAPVPAVQRPIAALRNRDLRGYLPEDLLCKVDTASMAVALEVRCPFLDRDLADAALATPIDDLLAGGRRKGLLRDVARRHLPAEAVDRPKMGFAIPIGEWFRDDTGGMRTLLVDTLTATDAFGPIDLDARAVRGFLDEHLNGKRDHGQRLFALLTLSMWAGGATDGPGTPV